MKVQLSLWDAYQLGILTVILAIQIFVAIRSLIAFLRGYDVWGFKLRIRNNWFIKSQNKRN